MSGEPISIPLSKGKLWWHTLGCVLFIALGFLFVIAPASFISPLIHNPLIIRILGFLSLIVFGYFLGAYIPKLQQRGPGLLIDITGITDHSTEASIGLIKWEDITEIRQKKITSNRFMIVMVKNPEDYIAKATEKSKIWWLKGNLDLCGSPIAISSQSLKCKFKELENILTNAFNHYKEES